MGFVVSVTEAQPAICNINGNTATTQFVHYVTFRQSIANYSVTSITRSYKIKMCEQLGLRGRGPRGTSSIHSTLLTRSIAHSLTHSRCLRVYLCPVCDLGLLSHIQPDILSKRAASTLSLSNRLQSEFFLHKNNTTEQQQIKTKKKVHRRFLRLFTSRYII